MKRYGIFLVGIFSLSLILTELADAQRSKRNNRSKRKMYPIDVGQVHPDFKLPNVDDGKPVSLGDYRGKKTLLVHFASW